MFYLNKSVSVTLHQQVSYLSYIEVIRQSQANDFIDYSLVIIDW